MKILVLGHKGMLGHMVVKYLQDNKVDVVTVKTRWPVSQIEINNFEGDYVINCIGAIPQRTKDFNINWQLPIWLDLHAPCKVIHPGTDCEMDDDDYGISKRVAANYINSDGKQTRIIKTSIIGPEIDNNASLLEWFLSEQGDVVGYSNAIWNGNTTLEWSKQCLSLMKNWDSYKTETIIYSDNVSKYELLLIMKSVFNKEISIISQPLGKDKSLKGSLYTKNILEQLKELKEYYYD